MIYESGYSLHAIVNIWIPNRSGLVITFNIARSMFGVVSLNYRKNYLLAIVTDIAFT